MDALLKDIYLNPKNPACFAGVNPVYYEAKRKNKDIKVKDVVKFLHTQDTYTLHKPIRKKFKRNRTIPSGFDTDWQADLCDMQKIRSENEGYGYILTCIDVLSRYAWGIPVKTKKPEIVAEAFEQILATGRKPWKLFTDKGLEFLGGPFQKMLKKEDIFHYSPKNPEIKCSMVERFNRTLKTRLWRLFTQQKHNNWTKNLDNLMNAINNSHHRSIDCTPASVTQDNATQLWLRLYGNKKPNPIFKFKVDDKVRIAKHKDIFEKGYIASFNKEVFTVVEKLNRYPPVYRLKDSQDETIDGTFYAEELVKVLNTDDIFEIETVIKTRKRKNHPNELFVKWKGYPTKYNSWIISEDLVTT